MERLKKTVCITNMPVPPALVSQQVLYLNSVTRSVLDQCRYEAIMSHCYGYVFHIGSCPTQA